jgi:hypothetical protein
MIAHITQAPNDGAESLQFGTMQGFALPLGLLPEQAPRMFLNIDATQETRNRRNLQPSHG